jgi:hypothetical protein
MFARSRYRENSCLWQEPAIAAQVEGFRHSLHRFTFSFSSAQVDTVDGSQCAMHLAACDVTDFPFENKGEINVEKQTQVIVDQQSCQEVEGITQLVETIEAKDAKIDSLLTKIEALLSEKNEWDDRAHTAENQLQSTAQELHAAKVELKEEQAEKNRWENRAIKAEQLLEKANSGKWWKTVLNWVGMLILTTIVGKAIENSSTQTINKTSTLFPVDEILSIPYEYAAMLWRATRVFLGL